MEVVWVRMRVPLGYAVGVLAYLLAEPTPVSLALGAAVSAGGELLRVWAAGHLTKGGTRLTISGPYRWTRNPLYLGSLGLGLGVSIATMRWQVFALLGAFFGAVYRPVMRAEAARLAIAFAEDYDRFARQVPLFWPRPGRRGDPSPSRFTWRRVVANGEHWTVAGWTLALVLLGGKIG
jgi:protein-S-isoprenylcysteine O-methyltransferase Ste14